MARYDKYSGVTGGFRAEAAEDQDPDNFDLVLGAGLDANGRMLLGDPANSGYVGVCIVDRTKRRAGNIQDIMTDGEIVDVEGLDPGTTYYLGADGTLGEAGRYKVGHTVESWRLVVRFQDQGAA